jgi:threonine dehydratase
VTDLAAIRAAAERIEPHVHRTPVLTSRFFDERHDTRVFFKCENFQRTGAFKVRGAFNAVLSLSDTEAAKGVVTHSSGNHGQAVACAARVRGIPAWIVMPSNAPTPKQEAVLGYGAEPCLCEPTLAARESTAQQIIERTGAHFIDSNDIPEVIAGQGTATLELLADAPGLDWLVTPVGGGGLLSGAAVAAAELSPSTRVVGAEPAGADDAFRSFTSGEWVPSVNPQTIADGLLVSLGRNHAWPIIKRSVHSIVTVSEDEIVTALRFVWQRMKIVIEPSSAVAVAALAKLDLADKRVGVILSGGNVAFPE